MGQDGWEARLDKYAILVKSGFATNDFGIVDSIIAGEQLSGIDHLATSHDLIDKAQIDPELKEASDKLKAINVEAVTEGKYVYQEFNNTVAELKDTTPDKPAWQKKIDDAGEDAKKLKDATSDKPEWEKMIDEAGENAKKLNPDAKGVPDQLKAFNIEAVTEGKNAYQEFYNTVAKLKGTTPDESAWKKKIDDAGEDLKKASVKAVDDSATAATAVIRPLPKDAQKVAEDIYVSGLQAVQAFFEDVWAQIKEVGGALHQFLQGNWTALERAWGSIQATAKTVLNVIRGTFNFSATLSGTLSGHDEGGQTASHGSHASEEGHIHSATHAGGHDGAEKRSGN